MTKENNMAPANKEEILEAEQAEQVVGSDGALLEELLDGVYTHTFAKPVLYDGKTYEKLTFDFDSLTGGDSLDVESELMARNHPVFVRNIDGEYLIRMAAKACTERGADNKRVIGHDIFRLMSAKDYGKITNIAKRFF